VQRTAKTVFGVLSIRVEQRRLSSTSSNLAELLICSYSSLIPEEPLAGNATTVCRASYSLTVVNAAWLKLVQ
jgi:hypothetical protein